MSGSSEKAPSREKLVSLRFDKGMTREDIAEHFDVSIATVRRWIKEMDVPRPSRRKRPKRPKNITSRGEIVARTEDHYNRLERALLTLGGRVVEFTGRGYYLDGLPVSAEEVVAAAE
jgi:transposase